MAVRVVLVLVRLVLVAAAEMGVVAVAGVAARAEARHGVVARHGATDKVECAWYSGPG